MYSSFSMAAWGGGAASVLRRACVMKRLQIAGLLMAAVRGARVRWSPSSL